jgi:hypothetical protein
VLPAQTVTPELRTAKERRLASLASVVASLRRSWIKGKMPFQAGLWSSMSQNRFKKTALCAIAGIALLLALVALLIVVEQRRTQAETGAVLSAFFSQEVLHDQDAQSRLWLCAIQIAASGRNPQLGSKANLGLHRH